MTEKSQDTIGMLLEINRLLSRRMTKHMQKRKGPDLMQLYALKQINECPQATMTDVAQIMNISPSTASAFIDRLSRQGYLKRNRDRTNKRRIFVLLTPNGKDAVRKGAQRKKLLLKDLCSCLSNQDQQHLQRILTRILEVHSTR